MNQPVRVCDDPPFGEGPVWCPSDGTIACTSVSEGALFRIDVATATSTRIAETGGGANGAALCADGGAVTYLVSEGLRSPAASMV